MRKMIKNFSPYSCKLKKNIKLKTETFKKDEMLWAMRFPHGEWKIYEDKSCEKVIKDYAEIDKDFILEM
jgi:hypothetical protein